MTLTPTSSYRALTARAGGLSGTITVTFTAPGQPTLKDTIAVVFAGRVATVSYAARHKHVSRKAKR